MHNKLVLIVLITLACISSRAQDAPFWSMLSPELRQFLIDHPVASSLISNAVSEASANRTLRVYYFYSNDETPTRSYHSYPRESVVDICIREKQQPCDECIGLVFEVLNSGGEKRFQELRDEASSGAISKEQYVREVMRQEFQAVKKTRELIGAFKLTQKELTDSFSYSRLIRCPSTFDEFFAYSKEMSQGQDRIHYEQYYDTMSGHQMPDRTWIVKAFAAIGLLTVIVVVFWKSRGRKI